MISPNLSIMLGMFPILANLGSSPTNPENTIGCELYDLDLYLLGADGVSGLLTGDAMLMGLITGVFPDIAPEGQPTPYIIYSLVSSQDTTAMGGTRAIANDIILIRATDQTENYASLRPITQRLETLLNGAVYDGPDNVLNFRRSGTMRSSEIYQGKSYRHSGAQWLMIAQPKDL